MPNKSVHLTGVPLRFTPAGDFQRYVYIIFMDKLRKRYGVQIREPPKFDFDSY